MKIVRGAVFGVGLKAAQILGIGFIWFCKRFCKKNRGLKFSPLCTRSRSTQRLQSRILRRTGTRRRDDPLRRTEQEIQHGHDLLPARPLRHRLRLGSRPGSDRRAVSGPQQPSRVQENRSNGCRNGFMTIQKRLDPFFEILLSLT